MKRISPRLLTVAIMLCDTRLGSPRDHRGLASGRVAAPIRSWSQMPVPLPRRITAASSSPARRASHKRSPASPRRRAGARGRAAPPQVEPHGRQPKPPDEASLGQLAHRPASPQRERPLQPAGRSARDPALAAPRQHPPAVEHAVLAPLAVALDPNVHGLAVDADYLGRLTLAQSLPLNRHDSAAPQLLPHRPADAANSRAFISIAQNPLAGCQARW
jgi:hypothetical protein